MSQVIRVDQPLKCWNTKGFCQFKIIIKDSSFRFIWMAMLSVYGHYKCSTFSMREPPSDVRIWRLKSGPALKGLKLIILTI